MKVGWFRFRFGRGATQLGFLDVLTVVILVGILLWVATLQFGVYSRPAAPSPSSSGAAAKH